MCPVTFSTSALQPVLGYPQDTSPVPIRCVALFDIEISLQHVRLVTPHKYLCYDSLLADCCPQEAGDSLEFDLIRSALVTTAANRHIAAGTVQLVATMTSCVGLYAPSVRALIDIGPTLDAEPPETHKPPPRCRNS